LLLDGRLDLRAEPLKRLEPAGLVDPHTEVDDRQIRIGGKIDCHAPRRGQAVDCTPEPLVMQRNPAHNRTRRNV
jgi:hypothetical protein